MFASVHAEYLGVAMYALGALGIGVVIICLNRLVMWALGTRKEKRGKYETYECGVPLLGSSRDRFSVKFYLVALLFVLFDIETVFLLPYAVSYKKLGMDAFLGVLVFVAVLGLGLLYILRRRALEWD